MTRTYNSLLIMLFTASLIFVNYNLYFNLLPLLPMLLLLLLNSSLVTNKLLYSFMFFMFLLFLSVLKFLFLDTIFISKGSLFSELNALQFIYVTYLILLFFFSIELYKNFKSVFLAALENILKFVIGLSFIAFLINIVGFNFSIIELLSGKEARFSSAESIGIGMVGVTEEPSTFGSILILFAILLFITNQNRGLALWALGFSFLTFSTAIWFIVPIIFGLLVFLFQDYFKNYPVRILIVSFIFLILVASFIINFQGDKITDGYAISIRLYLLELLSNRSAYMSLWGAGPWGYESIIKDLTDSWYGALRAASINDLGSLVFIYTYFGIIGIVFFLNFIINHIHGLRLKVLFLVVSLIKLSIMHPLFLVFMACFSEASKEKEVKLYDNQHTI